MPKGPDILYVFAFIIYLATSDEAGVWLESFHVEFEQMLVHLVICSWSLHTLAFVNFVVIPRFNPPLITLKLGRHVLQHQLLDMPLPFTARLHSSFKLIANQ
ncbi:hypothetical protein MT418_006164 [Batrachochytrium dendrobatidis]